MKNKQKSKWGSFHQGRRGKTGRLSPVNKREGQWDAALRDT